jgi:hypothetical protein
MGNRTRILVAFSALVLSACSASRAQYSISPSDVVRAQPANFAAIRTISGYLRFDSHSRQLWDDELALRNSDTSKCVTLINTQPHEDDLRSLNNSRVVIGGFPVEDVLSGRADFGACNRVGFYVRSVQADTSAISPRRVISSISALNGREIVVQGHLSFGSHARQLWHSRQARQEDDPDGCITLVNTQRFARLLRQRNGHTVTLVGKARSDVTSGYVDYGACDEVGLEIIRLVQ